MTTVGLDAFTRADSAVTLGTADVGGAWSVLAGTWGISSNRAYVATGVASNEASAVLDTGVYNGTVEVTVTTMGTSGYSGLTVRLGTVADGFDIYDGYMWDRGVGSQVGASFSATFVSGDRMRVVMSGTSITVFRQTGAVGSYAQVMTTTSSNYQTNTKHGLFVWGTGATNARFDDFSVVDVTTTVTAVPATATAMVKVPTVTADPVVSSFPDTKVEIAFDSGYATLAGSRTWTDVSQWVEAASSIQITHGRQDEFGVAEPNKLALTLDNSDGRFSPGYTSGAYYPDVKIGRPIRVTATVGGVDYVRFIGYVDEWPVGWDGTSNYSTAQITASSRLARLGFDSELRSVITELYLISAPTAYWPLQEPEGASSAVDLMGGPPLVNHGWGQVVTFGASMDLPGAPSETGADFLNTGSQRLQAYTLAAPISTAFPNTVMIEGFAVDNEYNVFVLGYDNGPFLFLYSSGDVWACSYHDGTNVASAVHSANATSATRHAAGMVELSATGDAEVTLWLDGEQVAQTTTAGMVAASLDASYIGDFSGDGQRLAHYAVNAEVNEVATRAEAGLTGFAGGFAGDRIELFAEFAGIDPTEVNAQQGEPVGVIETAGAGVIEAMRQVEQTEDGVLFDSRENILTFHARAHRYNTTSALTLNAATQQVEADVTPKLDRSTLVNEVTATTNADGSSVVVRDQASIDEYGAARTTLDIAGNQDAGYQAATRRVQLYAEPLPRIPALGVDLLPLTAGLQADLLEADVGTRITVAGLPAQAPAASIDFFIEGYTETIGSASYDFSFNVSPTNDDLMTVWILEDATYGVYDDYPLAY